MLEPKIFPKEIFQRRDEFGLRNSVNLLTEIIETDTKDERRMEAIKYFGLISISSEEEVKKQCYETLENLLISDDNVNIKCSAAKALGKIKYEKGLSPLKWVIEQDSIDNKVKNVSLKAITNIRFQEPEITLFIKKLDTETESIKKSIKYHLTSLGPEILITSLLTSLKNNNFRENHKNDIIKLIGLELSSINISFGDISFLEAKYPEIIAELKNNKLILLESLVSNLNLKDENKELMNSAITILKILGSEINDELIKLLLNDNFIVKKNAIKLVGKLKLADSVNFLIHNLDDIYNEVSIASIEALGEVGDLSAVPELLNVLNTDDIDFQYSDIDMKFFILDAVKKIYVNQENPSFDYLYTCLKSNNHTIKESVASVLGEIGKEDFIKPLIPLLKEKNLDVKKNVAIALGKIGSIEALNHLTKILLDDDTYWLIKKVVVDAIYNIYQKNKHFLTRIDDEKEAVRLLTKNTGELIHHLSTNENENFKVKLSIIKLLESYGGRPALSALLKRVNDFHRVVRIHASNAIKKIEEKLELEE